MSQSAVTDPRCRGCLREAGSTGLATGMRSDMSPPPSARDASQHLTLILSQYRSISVSAAPEDNHCEPLHKTNLDGVTKRWKAAYFHSMRVVASPPLLRTHTLCSRHLV